MVVGSSPTCGAKRDALGGVFFLLGTDLNLREGSETPWVSVPEILKPEGVKERSDRFVSFADLSIANKRKSYLRSKKRRPWGRFLFAWYGLEPSGRVGNPVGFRAGNIKTEGC